MPRRIEIELTSARPDGTWTWRAAGAREPKGVLDGQLLHEGAKAGDVLKAEADFELEGIVITTVFAPKADPRQHAQTIEVVGPGRPDGPGVTTQLVGKGERRDRRRDEDDRRSDRGPGRGAPRGDGGRPRREGAPAGGRPPRREGDARGREDGRDGARREATGGDRPRRDGRDSRDHREGPGARPPRPEGERRPGPARTSSQAERSDRGDRGDRSKARRLNPGSTHRKTVMEALPPEQQPIAEHLLRGGIPAVRTALHLEREKAEAEGRPAPNSEALLALAEELLPRLRAAEWRDRAEAAVAAIDDISMRDLRSVVAGADIARDDESRALATTLREAVESRVAKLHTSWIAEITGQLDSGKAVRAVRLSGRPPDAGAKLDPELTARLTEAAGATLGPDTSPSLWMSMLEALVDSPIRRSVVPAGLPTDAPPELRKAAHQFSGSIPGLVKMLGVAIPPPPTPHAARKRSGDRPDRPDRPRPPRSDTPEGAEAAEAAHPEEPAEIIEPVEPVEAIETVEAAPADELPVDPEG